MPINDILPIETLSADRDYICRYESISAKKSAYRQIQVQHFFGRYDSILAEISTYRPIFLIWPICRYEELKPIVYLPIIGSADIADYLQMPIIGGTLPDIVHRRSSQC